jgi:primosomal protein N' (replication factor Y) (superfamily II helicase)
MSFAEVVFNLPLNQSFTYKIPDTFNDIKPGHRVYVPFGKRVITGVVVALQDKCAFKNIKTIIDVLDDEPLLKPRLLELTRWIADYYMSGWGQAVQLALPKGLDEFEKEIIHLVEEDPDAELSEKQRDLYFIIADNPGQSKDYYRKKFGTGSFYTILNILKQKGLLYTETQKQRARVGVLLRDFVIIPADFPNIKMTDPDFLKYLDKRKDVSDYLNQNMGSEILVSQFLKETGMARATLQKMSGKGLVTIDALAVERVPEVNYSEEISIEKLTDEQNNTIRSILASSEKNEFKSFLLHGITGSGKTVVYIEILKEIIKKDRGAVILIPEIALTPQTVSRFKKVFGDKIAVFHSKMSAGQRYDAWMACYNGQVKIAIGPRSALFAPIDNIGLIVIDEEHDQSYKQSESAPLYNARDVALYWAKMHQAVVVLGSATPSFESYYNSLNKKHQLLEIKNRATRALLPDVHLVDMTGEKKNSTGSKIFSGLLVNKMRECISRQEQVIIFQNRRGYASFQQCLHCGFIAKCSDCEVTLTYHSYDNKLRCHYCGLTIAATKQCFNCGSEELINKGIGTQQVQEELQQNFPECNILRMDQDTTRTKNAHGNILTEFRKGHAQILLGTQMISKGLDFPNVTLVGVISADIGLTIPDFRSSEKVFQLLSQVAGRAGRGSKPGEVVIQSYQVNHYAIQFARNHDYKGFFNEEIKHRQAYNYPPFNRLVQITVSSVNLTEAITKAREIAAPLRRHGKHVCDVVGPAPAPISKLKNLYRWQVTLKIQRDYDPGGKKTRELLRKVMQPYYKNKMQSFFVSIDVDPIFAG